MPTTRTKPETIIAYARLLRLTDRLLDVAEEVREARDELQNIAESSADDRKQAGRGRDE